MARTMFADSLFMMYSRVLYNFIEFIQYALVNYKHFYSEKK